MRWVPLVVCLGMSTASAKPSNPAFLGVGMQDIGATPGTGPCAISQITKDSPAELAGLRSGDVLVAVDGRDIGNCDALLSAIQQHAPGDTIQIDVRRGGPAVALKATLLTREEVLRRRGIVGQPVPAATLTLGDGSPFHLADVRAGTTIVGWFDGSCQGCEGAFANVARWVAKRSTKQNPIRLLGALGHDNPEQALEDLTMKQRSFDVPLALVDTEVREDLTVSDRDRVYFMLIDHRGVVQHVAPVAPGADDAAAMLDELFATAEQCLRRSK